MRTHAPSSRLLISYARREAFADRTVAILARLGYRIVDVDEYAGGMSERAWGSRPPDLLIVDENRFDEVAASDLAGMSELPIILLTGRKGVTQDVAQIVGAVKRPAGLHDLYRLAQQVFEENPRSTPRVATQLHAVCGRDGRRWEGSLLSLSENGGLLRCSEAPPLGSCFDLRFDLPGAGTLELRAEAAYQLLPDLGVVFSGLEPVAREMICGYVSDCILA